MVSPDPCTFMAQNAMYEVLPAKGCLPIVRDVVHPPCSLSCHGETIRKRALESATPVVFGLLPRIGCQLGCWEVIEKTSVFLHFQRATWDTWRRRQFPIRWHGRCDDWTPNASGGSWNPWRILYAQRWCVWLINGLTAYSHVFTTVRHCSARTRHRGVQHISTYFATQVQHPELLSPIVVKVVSYQVMSVSWDPTQHAVSGNPPNSPWWESAKNLNSLGIKVSRSQNASKNIVLHRLNVAKHYFADPMTQWVSFCCWKDLKALVTELLLEASLTGCSSFRIFKGLATSENLREFNGGMAKNIDCQTPHDLPKGLHSQSMALQNPKCLPLDTVRAQTLHWKEPIRRTQSRNEKHQTKVMTHGGFFLDKKNAKSTNMCNDDKFVGMSPPRCHEQCMTMTFQLTPWMKRVSIIHWSVTLRKWCQYDGRCCKTTTWHFWCILSTLSKWSKSKSYSSCKK